jgi:EAL domain-containing protein (putative c-di-GMP-specific phosphodiesterase class I)
VTSLGRSLELKVVAEGVETADQLNFVRERGCHESQGFLFCRPLTAADMGALLKKGVDAQALTAA